jgi:hypothetical protein
MGTRWERREFNLPDNHGWTAKPGNRVFVANQGAVRFEVPNTWTIDMPKGSKSFQFFDGKPPNDDIRLDVRVMYLAASRPDVDWSQLQPWEEPPIADWLKKNIADDEREPTRVGNPLTIRVGDTTIVWAEMDFIDPVEKRPAHTRLCYAMKASAALLAIIAMDYWDDHSGRAKAAWSDILGTLKVGDYMESPFNGPGRR